MCNQKVLRRFTMIMIAKRLNSIIVKDLIISIYVYYESGYLRSAY